MSNMDFCYVEKCCSTAPHVGEMTPKRIEEIMVVDSVRQRFEKQQTLTESN